MKIYGLLGIFALLNVLAFNYFDSQISHATIDATHKTTQEQPADSVFDQTNDQAELKLQSYSSNWTGWQRVQELPAAVISQLNIIAITQPTPDRLSPKSTCAMLEGAAVQIFEGDVAKHETPFHDADLGLLGINCQLTVFNASPMADEFSGITAVFIQDLTAHGWLEDPTFIAYGPTETTIALTQDGNSGMLTINWQAVPATNCVFNADTICRFKPDLSLYTITFNFTVTPGDIPSI